MTRNVDSVGTRTCRPARSQEYHGPRVVLVVVLAMVGGNDHGAAQTLWRGLVVAPEVRCAPYDADAYRYPQSVEARIVAALGGVYGPYTGRWFASPRDTDIEHIVARSEAHDSGLCAADTASQRRFASDLLNLTLASGVGARMRAGLRASNRRARHLPMRYETGLPSSVIRFRTLHASTASGASDGPSRAGLLPTPLLSRGSRGDPRRRSPSIRRANLPVGRRLKITEEHKHQVLRRQHVYR